VSYRFRATISNLNLFDTSKSRYIHVYFYDTLDDLKQGARAYLQRLSKKSQVTVNDDELNDEFFEGLRGLFQTQGFKSKLVRGQWVDSTPAMAGVIRYVLEGLNEEIILHEGLHAALHISRMANWELPDGDNSLQFTTEIDDYEEGFCYLASAIQRELLKLYYLPEIQGLK